MRGVSRSALHMFGTNTALLAHAPLEDTSLLAAARPASHPTAQPAINWLSQPACSLRCRPPSATICVIACSAWVWLQDIKGWWIWAYYFNPATYTLYGTIITQLGDVHDEFITVGEYLD